MEKKKANIIMMWLGEVQKWFVNENENLGKNKIKPDIVGGFSFFFLQSEFIIDTLIGKF